MYSLLVKFARDKPHLEYLQSGWLYCNSIKYFTELEDNNIRGDKLESVVELQFIENGTLELKPAASTTDVYTKFDIKNLCMQKRILNPSGNIFCLSSISINPKTEPTIFEFDSQLKTFGNYALLIRNQPEFFRRVEVAAKKEKVKFSMGKVDYKDLHKYSGEKSLFQKDLKYSWQQEIRIVINRAEDDLFCLNIGNIEDISVLYNLDIQKQFFIKTN